MEPRFQQRPQLRQEMKLSPQMMQSLRFLQAPLSELREWIQTELETNPVLEEQAGSMTPMADGPTPSMSQGGEDREDDFDAADYGREIDAYEAMLAPKELEAISGEPATPEAEEKRQYFMDSLAARPSLSAFLEEQLNESGLDEEGKKAGEYIIGNVDENGWLTADTEEIAREAGVPPSVVERTLPVIQEFDPPGVAARNWKESIQLQLLRSGYRADSLPVLLVKDHLEELADPSAEDLARRTGWPVEDITAALHILASLDPRPGLRFDPPEPIYVTPEVEIFKAADGGYTAELLKDVLPRLHISAEYEEMLRNPETAADAKKYLMGKVRSGHFVIDSLHQRRETVRRIAQVIAEAQADFFDHGISRLKPLRMADVAEKIGVHETTVSRAVAEKYAQTPQGLLELRFFFTQGLATGDGGRISTEAVKEAVARLIAREDLRHPLSDQDIALKLSRQGTSVARRTVAKYREQLGIPPSHLRK
ncbi:MAG: RNA polymerase factor sigma-54 [Verrucomicrobiota bacterium]|jgi:RNA polymerase sigma-54 factor|nr:RNA polymerase factor sigma-54 [Verrucomicrobiota bacterium]